MTYISPDRRKKSATVRVKSDGKEKAKFPVDSPQTARSAIRELNHAKPKLTTGQKKHVLAEAAKYGAHPSNPKQIMNGKKKSGSAPKKRK